MAPPPDGTSGGGKPPKGGNQAPQILAQSFEINENSGNSTLLGVVVATDPEGALLTYTLVGGNDDGAFAIDGATGEITVADGTRLDHEGGEVRLLSVAVSDGVKTSLATMTVTILDLNEAPTGISLSSTTLAPNSDGAVVGALLVSDPDDAANPWGQHAFSVDDDRFEVVDGTLKLKSGQMLADGGTASVTVTATDGGGLATTTAFVVTATASPAASGVVNLGALAPSTGFTISSATGPETGRIVAAAGDVNGDGVDDFLVSDRDSSVHLIYGKLGGFDDFSLTDIELADGIRLFADAEVLNTATGIGDVNGDGFDDIAIGMKFGAPGRVVVVYGQDGDFAGDIDLLDLAPDQGFIVYQPAGNTGSFAFGGSVAAAGDVNGDGIDDFIIGDATGDGSARRGSQAGDAYVVFGKDAGAGDVFTDFTIDTLGAGDGFRIRGGRVVDQAGFSVSSAGDINNDGYDDVLVGAIGARSSGKGTVGGEGVAYVVYGGAGPGDIDLANFASSDGFRILGGDADDRLGWSVSAAGDVNGDGRGDIIVGAYFADGEGNLESAAGEAFIIFGSTDGFADIDVDSLAPGQGIRITGADAGDFAGYAVSGAGDVNGDGFADVLISATRADGTDGNAADAGEVFLVWGKASLSDIDLEHFTQEDGIHFIGADAGDQAGWSISHAGDINGDGKDDILIGAVFGNEAYVIYGWDSLLV